MIPAVKAEFKKMMTVRSTYAISAFFLLLLGFISFYGQGYKAEPGDLGSLFLAGTITAVGNIAAIAGALVGLLLMAHEYRYNTITYTLSATNSRTKVLFAKMVAISGYVLVYAIVLPLMALGLTALGAAAANHQIPHQDINYFAYVAKTLFFCEAYALAGLLVPTLVRNMQASVAILFIVPNTLEQLLTIVIKQPDKWLPFSALQQVVEPPVKLGPHGGTPNDVSPLHGAIVYLIYLAIGWAITWYLFLKRDSS